MTKKRLPPRDGCGSEVNEFALYYIQDTRQIVGNCMMFWCPGDKGYTCQLDLAGKYIGAEALSRCRDGTHMAWPVDFIEVNAVRHVRKDHLTSALARDTAT